MLLWWTHVTAGRMLSCQSPACMCPAHTARSAKKGPLKTAARLEGLEVERLSSWTLI